MGFQRLFAPLVMVVVVAVTMAADEPAPAKLRTAVIQWVADNPQLTYDVRFAGGDSTTIPAALKNLLRDLADSEGIYLTGESKSKTVASQNRRYFFEYTAVKSKIKGTRVSKVDVKEVGDGVMFVVRFGKTPGDDDLTRIDGVLETFARKYQKVAKGAPATVRHRELPKGGGWTFTVHFKEADAKGKK